MRVIERLIEIEAEAHKNLGDAAQLMQLYDPAQEEQAVAETMAADVEPADLFEDEEEDELALMLAEADAMEEIEPRTVDRPTFFRGEYGDLEFARAAFEELHSEDSHIKLNPPEFHASRPGLCCVPLKICSEAASLCPRGIAQRLGLSPDR